MIYVIGVIAAIVLYRFVTHVKQRQDELIEFNGTISKAGKEILDGLKGAYPNHKFTRQNPKEVHLHCFGPSHKYEVRMAYIPDAVYIDIYYEDGLGRKNRLDAKVDPMFLDVQTVSGMMQDAMNGR